MEDSVQIDKLQTPLEADRLDSNASTSASQSPVKKSDKTEKIAVGMLSTPIAVASPKPSKPVVMAYKMNVYRLNGQLRTDISKAVFFELSRRWGDIMRVISNNKFQSVDEICDAVWAAERKVFNRGHDRTRKQIEECVQDLLSAGLLLERAA